MNNTRNIETSIFGNSKIDVKTIALLHDFYKKYTARIIDYYF